MGDNVNARIYSFYTEKIITEAPCENAIQNKIMLFHYVLWSNTMDDNITPHIIDWKYM